MNRPKPKPHKPSGLLKNLLLLSFFCFGHFAKAQNNTVKGTVKDPAGVTLPSVTVTVKGSAKATATDLNGFYTISAPKGSTLVFRYIGFTPKEVVFTPDIVWRNPATFDIGNDELANEERYRNNKFYPDSLNVDRNQGNDVPPFRYADVLLMKAESVLRGANSSNGDSPLSLVNQVRVRAKATLLTAVALTDILDERGREFAAE